MNIKYRAGCGDAGSIDAKFVARTGDPDCSLVIRAQTIPTNVKAVLDDLGVTKS